MIAWTLSWILACTKTFAENSMLMRCADPFAQVLQADMNGISSGTLATVHVIQANADVLQRVLVLLSKLNVEIRQYRQAEDFLHDIASSRPQCLIVDVDSPKLDGVEFLKRLQQAGYSLPVIMLSADDDVPAAVRAIREGAWDFMQKPIVAQKFLLRVQQALAIQTRDGNAFDL